MPLSDVYRGFLWKKENFCGIWWVLEIADIKIRWNLHSNWKKTTKQTRNSSNEKFKFFSPFKKILIKTFKGPSRVNRSNYLITQPFNAIQSLSNSLSSFTRWNFQLFQGRRSLQSRSQNRARASEEKIPSRGNYDSSWSCKEIMMSWNFFSTKEEFNFRVSSFSPSHDSRRSKKEKASMNNELRSTNASFLSIKVCLWRQNAKQSDNEIKQTSTSRES